jgi:hypothetical protein
MIKKFENFKSLDTESLVLIFSEFIDNGAEHEYVEDSFISKVLTPLYFEIWIPINGIRRNERKWEKNPKIESYLESSKKQTEILENINVAIKRAFDEFGILPEIKEEDEESHWLLHLSYEF